MNYSIAVPNKASWVSFALLMFVPVSGRAQSTATSVSPGHGMQWSKDDDGVSLIKDDVLVLRYEHKSGLKPIVYPIIGPNGLSMTRDYPMKPASAGGTDDHIHHRSLWMTHGDVNGIDFWMEEGKAGQVKHRDIVRHEVTDEGATLVTTADWVTPEGERLLQETRTMTVADQSSMRTIEVEIDLKADNQTVTFGDTKEGSFAIRVPDSMAVDQKLGGRIINEHGEQNADAWGKRARWVDYSGPVDKSTVGITILEHPDSYGHPSRWHVRTYGLFAANPFGEHHFTGQAAAKVHQLKPGEVMHLHYKLLLHEGMADGDMIEEQYQRFAKSESPQP